MVEIALLGHPRVSVAGVPVDGDAAQRKRVLLLALLSDPPLKPWGRDPLIGLLWPESREGSARHLLSAALHVLRKSLGADCFDTSVEQVRLVAEKVRTDCDQFEEALEREDWAGAIQLHRGPFLDGLFVTEGNALEAWVEERRRRYRGKLAVALERTAAADTARQDRAAAISTWKKLAALDPHSGRFALGLMQAMVANGDRTGALRQARIHEQLIEAEFDTRPDEAILTLVEELKAGRTDAVEGGLGEAGAGEPQPYGGDQPVSVSPPLEATRGAPPRSPPFTSETAHVPDESAPRSSPCIVAVLPFAEPEGASTGGYLGDGIAETILEELGRFEGIQPVARSSSFAFRDAQRDAREIGQALGADMVLDGSVRRWENRGRFWVQLVDTDSGLQIWSHTYEREMGDVFEIQDDVGQAVAAALRARLRGGHAPAVPRPVSLDAWDRYIRGRHSWYERSIPSLETALDCFRGALELDPTYAEAWTGVADVYAQLGNHVYGLLPPDHAMPEARAAANKALVLRPDLSSAHTALAAVQFNYDWDLEEAERSYRRALELDPSNAVARLSYAFALASTERWEEAQVQLRRARELDPISAIGFTIRAHLRYFRRDFAGALDVVEDALKHDPTFRSAHLLRALIRVQLGEPGRALEELGAPPAGASGEPDTVGLGVSALLLGLSGDVAAASALGDQLAAMRAERFVPAECLALAALGSADWDGAVHWLGEAKSERSSSVLYVGLEPLVDPIRDHPGFPALLPDGPLSSTSDLSKGTDLKAD